MNYNIEVSGNFEKESKRLAKKYKSLKTEITELIAELETNPTKGTSLGNDIYKIRLAIKSKGKGKSGGARIISYVKVLEAQVLLFSIYNKSEKETLTDKEIKDLLKLI